jgi:hypothetical protein
MMDWIHVSTKTTRVVFDSAVLLQIFYTSPQMIFAAKVSGLKDELYGGLIVQFIFKELPCCQRALINLESIKASLLSHSNCPKQIRWVNTTCRRS